MKKIIGLSLMLLACLTSKGQETKLWTEADRKYLLDNLIRSREALVKETENEPGQEKQRICNRVLQCHKRCYKNPRIV